MDGEPIMEWLARQRDQYWKETRWILDNNRILIREGIALCADVIKVYKQVISSLDSLHDRGLYCGDLLGTARVIDGSRVVIAENILAYADLSEGIFKDLTDFQVLILAAEFAVSQSIHVLSSWSSYKFHQLFQSIPPITATVEEFRYFTFYVLHNPLFMDVKAKYLFFRKILIMYENSKSSFSSSVSLVEMRDWVQIVTDPKLLAIKNYTLPGETVPVNENKYRGDFGCIDFFRNAFGHIRDNIASGRDPVFIDDSTILFMLEDNLPMAIPIWFYSVFKFLGAFVPPQACKDLCDHLRLKEFLERTISFCA